MKRIFMLLLVIMFSVGNSSAGVVARGVRFGAPLVSEVVSGFIGNTARNDGELINSTSVGVFDEFVTTTAGTIRYVHVYIESGTNDFNVAIYNADGTTLLADSVTQNVGGTGWFHFQLDSPIIISDATTYILSFGTSSDTYWACGLKGGGGTYFKDTSYTTGATMPSSISKDTTVSNWHLSIYADNSPTGV